MAGCPPQWNVLVQDGHLLQNVDATAPAFLRSQPPGVYTTTRIAMNASRVLLWKRHLTRFAHSIEILALNSPQLFPKGLPEPWKSAHCLHTLFQPSMKVAIQKALSLKNELADFIITAYAGGSTSNESGITSFIHITEYNPDSKPPLADVAVMGAGRGLPNAKSSQWVSTRQCLEQARPSNITEILLSNDGDSLLEGMVTNFFVVGTRRKMGAGSEDAQTNLKMDLEIQTAPLEGVLPGVIRKLIFEICSEKGLTISEIAPQWADRLSWKESFLSNSVRFIQPVNSITIPIIWDSNLQCQPWAEDNLQCLGLQAPGQITSWLQEQVWQRAIAESVPVQDFLT